MFNFTSLSRPVALLCIIYLAFVSLGLPDGVLGVAWPAIRGEMGLPLESVGLLLTLLLVLSAFSSVVSGFVLRRLGTGLTTMLSGVMTGIGLLGFVFAPGFWWLALCIVPLGLGQGAVDSGLNLYVARHYSSRHMNWLHCFWGVGAAAGPVIMTTALLTTGWREGYGSIAAIQLGLAAVLWWSLRAGLWADREDAASAADANPELCGDAGLFGVGDQTLAVLLFFLYVGMEYSVGLWLNSLLVESRGIPVARAGLTISAFYASIMAGRFFSGIVVNRLGNTGMIRAGLFLAAAGAGSLWFSSGYPLALAGAVLMGLGFAPVYPCLMHETPRRFRKNVSERLIGFQVGAACLGGSVVSSGLGFFMSRTSLEMLCPVLLILIVLTFTGNEILSYRRSLK